MAGNPFGLAEKHFKLLAHNVFQINNGNFVPAFAAEIFRVIGGHIHFAAAGAMGQAAEQMHRGLGFCMKPDGAASSPARLALFPAVRGAERLAWPPAWGKGARISGQAKQRRGAAAGKRAKGATSGGAKSGRVGRRSLAQGKPRPARLGDGASGGLVAGVDQLQPSGGRLAQ